MISLSGVSSSSGRQVLQELRTLGSKVIESWFRVPVRYIVGISTRVSYSAAVCRPSYRVQIDFLYG